jgi:hypothetical protein
MIITLEVVWEINETIIPVIPFENKKSWLWTLTKQTFILKLFTLLKHNTQLISAAVLHPRWKSFCYYCLNFINNAPYIAWILIHYCN